jgi:hypothetical protein
LSRQAIPALHSPQCEIDQRKDRKRYRVRQHEQVFERDRQGGEKNDRAG